MADHTQETVTVIQANTAKKEDLSWIDHQVKEKQETLKRLEETSKYLSGLSSVTLTIMVGPNKEVFKDLSNSSLLKSGIICWLISILFTLAVLFPFRYRYIENSAQSIKLMNDRTARIKYTLLVLATLLYLTGICITVYLYLFNIPSGKIHP